MWSECTDYVILEALRNVPFVVQREVLYPLGLLPMRYSSPVAKGLMLPASAGPERSAVLTYSTVVGPDQPQSVAERRS
jgi:hypothetical protein